MISTRMQVCRILIVKPFRGVQGSEDYERSIPLRAKLALREEYYSEWREDLLCRFAAEPAPSRPMNNTFPPGKNICVVRVVICCA
jgi:hypothetical protein